MSVEYVVKQLTKELDRATPTGGMQVANISVPIKENLLQVTILHLEKLEKDNAELKAQIGNATVHTIDGSCYVKCADIMHEDHRKSLNEIKDEATEQVAVEEFNAGFISGWMDRHCDTDADEDSTPEHALREFISNSDGDTW